jgi:hypothetical protein
MSDTARIVVFALSVSMAVLIMAAAYLSRYY